MGEAFISSYWACVGLYACAVAAQLFGRVFARPRASRLGALAAGAGLTLHSGLVAWRWVATGHVPTIGDFENALVGGWFIVAMALWAGRGGRHPLLAAGTLPFALLVLGWGGLSDTAPRPMVAALQSFWLYVHIFFAWLAYGAYTVAAGAGVVYLARSRPGRMAAPEALAALEERMVRSTVFGFITDAVMIAAGSIWARNLWGAYWSWDPVETWSLLSWLVYGLALHLRFTLRWGGRRLAWLIAAAIVGVLISFWGVNLVMRGSAHVFNVG